VPELEPEARLVLRTLYAAGLRGQELCGLQQENVKTDSASLQFGDREALLDHETCQQLAGVDWSRWDWPVSRITTTLHRAAKLSGLGKRYAAVERQLLPHALRVAFAVHALENGSGLFALHHLLGYPYLGDTEMVIELAVGLWRAPYDKAHPLARPLLRGGGKQSELSYEEVMQMIEAAGEGIHNTHNGLILRTIYAAGLRVSELSDLRIADVEIEERRLFLRDCKEAKDRYTLIDSGTAEQLQPVLASRGLEEPVFTYRGKAIKDSFVRELITAAGKKTGLGKKWHDLGRTLSPHTFRHAHATHLYAGGMEPGVIKKLLGHDSVDQTMDYVACGPSEWREAYDRCRFIPQDSEI
jgi:site-specific recombinase XerD